MKRGRPKNDEFGTVPTNPRLNTILHQLVSQWQPTDKRWSRSETWKHIKQENENSNEWKYWYGGENILRDDEPIMTWTPYQLIHTDEYDLTSTGKSMNKTKVESEIKRGNIKKEGNENSNE